MDQGRQQFRHFDELQRAAAQLRVAIGSTCWQSAPQHAPWMARVRLPEERLQSRHKRPRDVDVGTTSETDNMDLMSDDDTNDDTSYIATSLHNGGSEDTHSLVTETSVTALLGAGMHKRRRANNVVHDGAGASVMPSNGRPESLNGGLAHRQTPPSTRGCVLTQACGRVDGERPSERGVRLTAMIADQLGTAALARATTFQTSLSAGESSSAVAAQGNTRTQPRPCTLREDVAVTHTQPLEAEPGQKDRRARSPLAHGSNSDGAGASLSRGAAAGLAPLVDKRATIAWLLAYEAEANTLRPCRTEPVSRLSLGVAQAYGDMSFPNDSLSLSPIPTTPSMGQTCPAASSSLWSELCPMRASTADESDRENAQS
eukprot:GFYU01009573.1.p1 GENE.GFYU01009573.1~~GFYU01009573.1.p1  ORF type:complete len:372 (-),score=55.71 GFYU01009573.1:189-1304(-)